MAYQPQNFTGSGYVAPQDQGYGDIFRNILSGYAGGYLPQQLQTQAETAQLEQELLRANAEKARMNGGIGELHGEVGNAFKVAILENMYGPDDPRVMAAKNALELQQEGQRGLMDYRNQLSESAPKRFSTAQGKLLQELDEINSGYLPGSDYKTPISKEQQTDLRNQYELALFNKNTNSNFQNRAALAENIEKTLEAFDVKDLVKYSGVAGGIAKKIEQGKSLTGRESEAYRKHQDSLTAVDLLASQIRQFYGDSVTASMRRHLEELANPSSWANNPQVAERKFNTLRHILKKETETYRKALNSPKELRYGSAQAEQSSGQNNVQQKFTLGGQVYNIPAELVEEFLAANPGAKRNG